jgi:hypothetical protein
LSLALRKSILQWSLVSAKRYLTTKRLANAFTTLSLSQAARLFRRCLGSDQAVKSQHQSWVNPGTTMYEAEFQSRDELEIKIANKTAKDVMRRTVIQLAILMRLPQSQSNPRKLYLRTSVEYEHISIHSQGLCTTHHT